MAEEAHVMSIQQRIAALKQAQGPSNGAEPPIQRPQQPASRPAPVRNKTVANPPTNGHATGNGASANGHVSSPQPPLAEAPQKKAPPPLPSRRPPAQRPTPPPRQTSSDPSRRNSTQSTASDTSLTTPSVKSTSSTASRVRAPAYGETELPTLPPRRDRSNDTPLPSRPKLPASQSTGNIQPPPALPARNTNDAGPRPAPVPPPTPSRNNTGRSQTPNGEARNDSPRRLPPTAMGFSRDKSFKNLNKEPEKPEPDLSSKPNGTSQDHAPSPVPPPVPLASRPDLSKIQATKPRVHASNSATPADSAGCMVCRDFSAPDAHAARYPRESLPTHDLSWLGNELTRPFPSHTDKARAIFTWLHHNIAYDVNSFFNHSVQPSTPNSTFTSGLAVCQGYAELFVALAKPAGLEALVVSGHGKGYGYSDLSPGSPVPPYEGNHAWNAVRIDNGVWKLIDATWGAGHIQGPGQPYIKQFTPAMFTSPNDEFGLRHFPSNPSQFFREDPSRPRISWDEYILGIPNCPLSAPQPRTFCHTKKYAIGERTFFPAATRISISQPGPIRFQFSLFCPHWSLERHSHTRPSLFLLMVHGIDGRKDDRLPFHHVRGSGGGGGGDTWYVDVPNPRSLGAPGQKAQIGVMTKFGDREDARGLTEREYWDKLGGVAMSWAYIAEWELVV